MPPQSNINDQMASTTGRGHMIINIVLGGGIHLIYPLELAY